jgi:membrane-associated phospholipid phosphatase
VSKTVFLPRPFIQSQKAFHLEGGRLVQSPRLAYRVPLDDESQSDYRKLLEGNILPNHLGSFPSDHAGFYATLAAGTWLASRQLGTVALVWTFVVILGTRIVNGMHSPLDIAAGAGLGIGVLLACQWTLGNWAKGPLDAVTRWTLRHPALSSVVMFIVAFESANTLDNLRPLLKTALNLGKWLIGG